MKPSPRLALFIFIAYAHLLCSCLASGRSRRAPKLELSGWRSMGAMNAEIERPRSQKQHQQVAAENANRMNKSKLIEWDDEENLANDFNDSNKSADLTYLLTFQDEDDVVTVPDTVPSSTVGPTSTSTSTSTTTTAPLISLKWPEEPRSKQLTWKAMGKRPAAEEKRELAKFWWNSVEPSKIKRPSGSHETAKLKLASDWKPVATDQKQPSVASRGRRASGNAKPAASSKSEKPPSDIDIVTLPGSHWRPISVGSDDEAEQLEPASGKGEILTEVNTTTATPPNETIIYGGHKPSMVIEAPRYSLNSINEPFDDDGIIVAIRTNKTAETTIGEPKLTTEGGSQPGLTSKVVQFAGNRWIPIEHGNSSSGLGNSTNEQKSASDLNYIYSSQPGSSYSYGTQQQQPVVTQEQPTAIIDTSSGQLPEMVTLDQRTPEVAQVVQQQDAYVSQVYKQPTMSQPLSEAYYPYRNSQSQLQTQQMTPAPSRQLVREEHHHHYYNQRAQRDQQLQQSGGGEPSRGSIIREIQPLLITQPIFQQQQLVPGASTTPAPQPQIIREIIKEVPIQTISLAPPPPPIPTIQLSRAIQLPAPAIPVAIATPDAPIVNFQPTGTAAQQIFRQISNNMPSVRVQIPQIRFPLPGLQLPVRLAAGAPVGNQAPVTRQTGSFVIPPMPKKTTTYLTQTQAVPTHTTIMHTTQFTPATRTTVYTTEHQAPQTMSAAASVPAYKRR